MTPVVLKFKVPTLVFSCCEHVAKFTFLLKVLLNSVVHLILLFVGWLLTLQRRRLEWLFASLVFLFRLLVYIQILVE